MVYLLFLLGKEFLDRLCSSRGIFVSEGRNANSPERQHECFGEYILKDTKGDQKTQALNYRAARCAPKQHMKKKAALLCPWSLGLVGSG
jgi:hypothetical protein